MFRKLEEMSKDRPVAVQPKQQFACRDYLKGNKLNIICTMQLVYIVMFYIFVV